ncbi:MAG: bifunctional nuclease domain-containing protein [bacterium]
MPKKFAFPAVFLLLSASLTTMVCSTIGQEQTVLMKIAGIRGNPSSGQVIVILKEENGLRILPIVVGEDQALSIHLGYEGVPAPRPLTHDLLAKILQTVETQVEKIVITELREGTYYAEIVLQHSQKTHKIDARPSDAIALALRVEAPIYCHSGLLQQKAEQESETDLPPHTVAQGLGFIVQDLTPSLAQFFGRKEGVLISEVRASSPAEKAGLRAGDVVIRVNEVDIDAMRAFVDQLVAQKSSPNLAIEYLREGEARKTVLTK